jgi:hypothetical protein
VSKRAAKRKKTSAKRPTRPGRRPPPAVSVTVRQIDSLRDELRQRTGPVPRWNADPEDVQRSVARLVLSLVEFLRKLMERQAIRRMDAGTLADDEVEAVGQALMRLEETVRDIAARFDLAPEDLNLDLGPIGRLT